MNGPTTGVYKRPASHAPPRGGGRSVIEAAKRDVPVVQFAERELGTGVRFGREVFFRCPFHDDRTPSLRISGEKDLWLCDPCGFGGDVVRLAELLWEHERADVAAAELLMLFGHGIPPKPPSWFRKQERQKPVRDGLGRIREEVLRRRLFRILEPLVSGISDDEERAAAAEYLWRELTPLAARMVRERVRERGAGS
jgi:hypothetical protein